MIQLIADSGSTTAKWRLKNGSVIDTYYTAGLNPYFRSPASVHQVIQTELRPQLQVDSIDELHFYGAGCDSPEYQTMIYHSLQRTFTHTNITVEHDLLGSARACFFNKPGIVCILGTGSNSCRYDGQQIVEHIPSLAFILGDEASAGYFGKILINRYFRGELPADLQEKFEASYNVTLSHIMENVYRKARPNRFIASYATFLGTHAHHPFVKNLLTEGFKSLMNRLLKKYSGAHELPISFVGAVAFNHQQLIKKTLKEEGLKPGIFLKNPLDRLTEFHST